MSGYAVARRPRSVRPFLTREPYVWLEDWAAPAGELEVLAAKTTRIRREYLDPVTVTYRPQNIDDVFQKFAQEWRDDVRFVSSVDDLVNHPAYQSIITLGREAVPSILRALEREPDHWFEALRMITGANPIAPDDEGRVDAMANAWLQWARDHNIAW